MSISTHETGRNMEENTEITPCMADAQYIADNAGPILWVSYYCDINFQMSKLKQSESEPII